MGRRPAHAARTAPVWFAKLLERHRDLPVERPEVLVDLGRATAYGAAALRREIGRWAGAKPGTRNDSLNRAAFALGQLVASGALEEASTAEALMGAGLGLGLGERECERTITSGMGAGMDTPRSLTRALTTNVHRVCDTPAGFPVLRCC